MVPPGIHRPRPSPGVFRRIGKSKPFRQTDAVSPDLRRPAVFRQNAAFAVTKDDHDVAVLFVVESADWVARFKRRNLPTQTLESVQPIVLEHVPPELSRKSRTRRSTVKE